MKRLISILFSLILLFSFTENAYCQTTTTYTFSSLSWAASPANWTSGGNGNGFTAGQGVQVTTGKSGANATSPRSFTNVTRVVVTYNTNKSAGAGAIKIKIGSNAEVSHNVSYTSGNGTSANYTTTFDFSPNQSGTIKLTTTVTTNSIWVKSIAITEGGAGCTKYTVSFNNAGGTNPSSITQSECEAAITLPVATLSNSACTDFGWVFAGWSTSSSDYSSLIDTYTPTANTTLYAVYKNLSNGSSGSKTFTISSIASANSWTSGTKYATITDSPVTLTACCGANDGKYYSSNQSWRIYSSTSGTVTVSVADGLVTSVTSTPSATFNISNGVATCTASGSNIEFTRITVNYTSGNVEYSYNPTCENIDVDGVTLNKSSLIIYVEEKYQLEATISPSNATNKTVSWLSDDTDIVTVDNTGKITGISEGVTDVTVTTNDGNFTAICTVTVLGKPIIDIAKWDTNAIYVDIDNFAAATAILENQNTQAVIKQKEAMDLFFAKYFEGEGNIKMISIFNGTSNDINLENYEIVIYNYNNSNNHTSDSNNDTIDFTSSDIIYSGQEIIFYSKDNTVQAVQDCSESFFNSIADKSNTDDNPRWIERDDIKNAISGNDYIQLLKNGSLIDIFGAVTKPSVNNCRSEHSWAGTILNMDFKKTENDFSTEVWEHLSDYGINIYDSILDVHTARCVLYRSKEVLGGDSAVRYNTDKFNTLTPNEWYGRNVCHTGVVSGAGTCNSYSELGKFNYEEYYAQYDTIIGSISMPDSIQDDGTYKISIPGLDTLSCTNLKIVVKDAEDHEVSQAFKIPIMVSKDTLTTSELFTKEGPDCATCDVIVLANKTLKASGTTSQNRNVKVYEGGKLSIPSGTTYAINSLALRQTNNDMSYLTLGGTLNLSGDSSLYYDLYTDPSDWRWIALPESFDIRNIKLSNGKSAGTHKVDYWFKIYDGGKRAREQCNGWISVSNNKVFTPGEGFIFGSAGDGAIKKEYRFKFSNDALLRDIQNKTVAWDSLKSWGCDRADLRPNHKGWNLVGNPFMSQLNSEMYDPIRIGYLEKDMSEGHWNGQWVLSDTVPANKKMRYRIVKAKPGEPTDDGSYRQELLDGDIILNPFQCFFIQLGGTTEGTHSLSMAVDHKRSVVRRAPATYDDEDDELFLRIYVNDKKTGMFISNSFTDDYEPGDDFESRQSIYQNIGGYKLLYSAIPDSTLINGIVIHSAGGLLKLDDKVIKESFEYIYVLQNDNWYDLMTDEYNIESGEFILYAKRKIKEEITTDNNTVYINNGQDIFYDILGRKIGYCGKGVYIIKNGNSVIKTVR